MQPVPPAPLSSPLSQEFNPSHLCYQSAGLPEARGHACVSFAAPLIGNEQNSVLAHTKLYLKATETLLIKLSSPLSPNSMARIGQHFLNNISMAHEIQDALLKDLIFRIQRAETTLNALMQIPDGQVAIHVPPVTPPRQPRIAQITSQTAQLTVSVLTFLAVKAYERGYEHFYPSPSYAPALPPASPPPAVPVPLTAADYSAAVRSYEQHVITPLQNLFQALDEQTIALRSERNLLAAPVADAPPQDLSQNPRVQQAKRQYENTLRKLRTISNTMHDHFKELTCAQNQQWNRILNTIRPAHSVNNDHAESDIKTSEPIAPPVLPSPAPSPLLGGNRFDPRVELLFLQRLRENNLHVINVPGNGHCALYSLFKDPHVLPCLRPFLDSLPGATPIPGARALTPTESLSRDVRLTRQLIVERVKAVYDQAPANERINIQLAKKWEIEECPQAKQAYSSLYRKNYVSSPEEYQKLEACYWSQFVTGEITLSSDHLSALSMILERPILVYSMNYLTPANIEHHLLRNSPAGAPLPAGVLPVQENFHRIPVQPAFVNRLDEMRPIRIYHSYGHYQAMKESKY